MDPKTSSVQTDTPPGAGTPAAAMSDSLTGVEYALSRLASSAARDIFEPRTRAEVAMASTVPPVVKPTAPPPVASAVPPVAKPTVSPPPVASAIPPVAKPSVPPPPSVASAVPPMAKPATPLPVAFAVPPVAKSTVPTPSSVASASPLVVKPPPSVASASPPVPGAPVANPSVPPPSVASTVPLVASPPLADLSVPAPAPAASTGPRLAEPSSRIMAADIVAVTQADAPSVLAAVRPAEFRAEAMSGERSSPRTGVTRTVRLAIAVCVGVGGSLAWQSYGGAARDIIASQIPLLAWFSSPAATSQTPDQEATTAPTAAGPTTEEATAQAAPAATDPPQGAAAPAAGATQTEPDGATTATDSTLASADHRQLQAMAREIGSLRQSVDQLLARQEQMTREMAKLHTADTFKRGGAAPPPRPDAATARKPRMPSQAAPLSSGPFAPQPPPPRTASELRPPPVMAPPLPPAAQPQPPAGAPPQAAATPRTSLPITGY
jgi:hypothetical protein